MRSLFGGRRRSVFGHGKELGVYRNELFELTQRIDRVLATVVEEIDALRRRDLEPDVAVARLGEHEAVLDADVSALQKMMAPEELHGLHMEYEANLERALRGIVTVERGCAITRLPHRPPDDEEPHTYYKRGHSNVAHARLRMAEIVEVLLHWEPGRPAEASVAARLERTREG
ncbi:MAG: hypothetical protein H0T94_00010 [Acidimicrobiia bacterium]|nr:hypothetical protein [Acidimicrobiia bacterium]